MSNRVEQQEPAPLHAAEQSCNPGLLRDSLVYRMHLKEDAALARILNTGERLILKIRERRLQNSGSMLLIQEAGGISVGEPRLALTESLRKSRMAGSHAFPAIHR